MAIEALITSEAEPPLPYVPSLSVHLGRTKISGTKKDEVVHLAGDPVDAPNV